MAIPKRRADGEWGAQRPVGDWRVLHEIEAADAVEAFVARHPRLEAILVRAPSEIAARFKTRHAQVSESKWIRRMSLRANTS